MTLQANFNLLPLLTQEAIENNYNRPTSDDLLRAALQRGEWAATRKSKLKSKISISEVGKCQREIAYGFYPEYVPEDVATPDQRILWDEAAIRGDWVHKAWQGALVESGLVWINPKTGKPAVELWLNEIADFRQGKDLWERRLTGRVDVILKDKTYCEIKSVAHKDFNISLPWFKDKLKAEQSQLYMHFSGLTSTKFIVVDRDGDWFRDIYEIELPYNPALVSSILAKIDLVNWNISNSALPEPDPGKQNKNCMFCGFKKYCPATT